MCHPDSPSVCGDSYQKEGCSRLRGHWVPDTERISQAESGSLWDFRTQPLLCFHLPSPPSCSSPGRKVLTVRSTYTPHTGSGFGDSPALLLKRLQGLPQPASPASTPHRCWNHCSQRIALSSAHRPGPAPVGKAGRPSGKAGSSRALRPV